MAGSGMGGMPKLFALLLLSLLLAVVVSPSMADASECERCTRTFYQCRHSCLGGPDVHKCIGFCENRFRRCKAAHCSGY